MPTVYRFAGLRVAIYPNDHPPAHVHVMGGGCEALFNLNCPGGPAEVRQNYSFAEHALGRIEDELSIKLRELCAAWERIHGLKKF